MDMCCTVVTGVYIWVSENADAGTSGENRMGVKVLLALEWVSAC